MKKFRQVVLAAAAALVLAGLAPAQAAAQSYCDTLTNGLRLPKPNFNTPGWQFGGCIRNSFDIINSSVPLIGSTATFSQIWTSTISGRNGSGLYLSSYAVVGSSVYIMGHAQFGSSATFANGAGIGGAVTFTASTLTVNGLYARYGVQATTGSFTSGLVTSTLTVVGDSIHRDIANNKAVRVTLGSTRPQLNFTDEASASLANGSIRAADLWLNPDGGNITSWGLHSFRSTIELTSGQAITNAATFTGTMTVRGASTFTATGDSTFSLGTSSGVSIGGGGMRFADGTYQYTATPQFFSTMTAHAAYILNNLTVGSSVTVVGVVASNSNMTAGGFFQSTNAESNSQGNALLFTGPGQYWGMRQSTDHGLNFDLYTTNWQTPLKFVARGGEADVILSSAAVGRVGIGTASPSVKLDVVGAANVSTNLKADTVSDIAGADLEIQYAATGATWICATANCGVTAAYFKATTGNVGIGTTGPDAKLDVNGNAQFGSGVAKATFSATGMLAFPAGGGVTTQATFGSSVTVNNHARIYGTGTEAILTIGGASGYGQVVTPTGATALYVGVNNNGGLLYLRGGADRASINLANDYVVVNEGGIDIDFRVEGDNNANLINVDASADKVGIGVTPTLGLLHLDIGTGVGQATFEGSTGGCIMLRDTDDAGWTEVDALDGVLTASVDADGVCD